MIHLGSVDVELNVTGASLSDVEDRLVVLLDGLIPGCEWSVALSLEPLSRVGNGDETRVVEWGAKAWCRRRDDDAVGAS